MPIPTYVVIAVGAVYNPIATRLRPLAAVVAKTWFGLIFALNGTEFMTRYRAKRTPGEVHPVAADGIIELKEESVKAAAPDWLIQR